MSTNEEVINEQEPEGFVEKDRSRRRDRRFAQKQKTLDGKRIRDPGYKKERFRYNPKDYYEDDVE